MDRNKIRALIMLAMSMVPILMSVMEQLQQEIQQNPPPAERRDAGRSETATQCDLETSETIPLHDPNNLDLGNPSTSARNTTSSDRNPAVSCRLTAAGSKEEWQYQKNQRRHMIDQGDAATKRPKGEEKPQQMTVGRKMTSGDLKPTLIIEINDNAVQNVTELQDNQNAQSADVQLDEDTDFFSGDAILVSTTNATEQRTESAHLDATTAQCNKTATSFDTLSFLKPQRSSSKDAGGSLGQSGAPQLADTLPSEAAQQRDKSYCGLTVTTAGQPVYTHSAGDTPGCALSPIPEEGRASANKDAQPAATSATTQQQDPVVQAHPQESLQFDYNTLASMIETCVPLIRRLEFDLSSLSEQFRDRRSNENPHSSTGTETDVTISLQDIILSARQNMAAWTLGSYNNQEGAAVEANNGRMMSGNRSSEAENSQPSAQPESEEGYQTGSTPGGNGTDADPAM